MAWHGALEIFFLNKGARPPAPGEFTLGSWFCICLMLSRVILGGSSPLAGGGWKKKTGWGDTCIKMNDKWFYWRQHGWAWGISNGICLFCVYVVGWHPVELLNTWTISLSQQRRDGLCSVSLVRSAMAPGVLRGVAGLALPLASELRWRPGTDVAASGWRESHLCCCEVSRRFTCSW